MAVGADAVGLAMVMGGARVGAWRRRTGGARDRGGRSREGVGEGVTGQAPRMEGTDPIYS